MSVPVLLSWSSGKDSAWALHILRQNQHYDVKGLFTTINQAYDRVAMHGVRRSLLEAQARAAKLPLHVIEIPDRCVNEDYEAAMAKFVDGALKDGIQAMAFGDLYLEDVRAYREQRLKETAIEPIFPLWGVPTRALAQEMVTAGLRAHLTCIDPRKLNRSFAGRAFDQSLLDDFPEEIDPCGENGEFHSFVSAGPMLSDQIAVQPGEVVERDGFIFADLMPILDNGAI